MCTLTLAWQVFPDAPVVVAANRDESYGRPSLPPAKVEDDPAVVAPLDEQAGGTWIGYNESGLFAGITNRWVTGLAGERSRGLLVRDVLRESTAEDAARLVENAVDDHEYEGFNFVVADENAAFLLAWDGHLNVRQYEPGVHVVVNVGTDDSFFVPPERPDVGRRQAENARRVREALRPEPSEADSSWLDRAAAVLGDHDYGVCIHGDGFGTKSSSLIVLRPRESGGVEATYEFADGPPCETSYRPIEDQL